MAVNFADIEEKYSAYENAKIVILPAPYDETSTWMKGADKGPAAIIQASANMELYDIETDSEVYRQGIFTAEPITENASPQNMVDAVYRKVRHYLAHDKFVVTIGGEHSVSLGPIKAYKEKYPDMCVLQLDAHADLRDEYSGSKYNHACVTARIKETAPVIQVGIRSMDVSEKDRLERDGVFFAEDIINNKTWTEQAVAKLSEHVYVTIDLDVFDPAIMPSTGTPEPGGLSWYDVLELLKTVCHSPPRRVVGFDVVELCPNEQNKAPDFLAAKLIYKTLSYRFGK